MCVSVDYMGRVQSKSLYLTGTLCGIEGASQLLERICAFEHAVITKEDLSGVIAAVLCGR